MARPELGTKRVCPKTGKKFYDLNKDPIVSPYTGEIIPRSFYEPQTPKTPLAAAAAAAAAVAPIPVRSADDDVDAAPEDAELISLEEADAEAAGTADVADDDVEADEAIGGEDEDTFLEEEEEDDADVSDLIDGDLEDDEET